MFSGTGFRSIFAALVLACAAVIGSVSGVFADDWEAVKLRGSVFALEKGVWVPLERGSIVSDSRVIRTAKNGRAQFKRDNETIDLEPDTQIKIFDYAGSKFTVVQQHFGQVSIEAEKLNVQHFAVQTKHLAAVVKGTKFTVRVDDLSASVSVQRGQVQVRDTDRNELVEVERGQRAEVAEDKGLKVSGSGKLNEIVKYRGSAVATEVVIVATKQKQKSDNAGAGNANSGNGKNKKPSKNSDAVEVLTNNEISAPGKSGDAGDSDNKGKPKKTDKADKSEDVSGISDLVDIGDAADIGDISDLGKLGPKDKGKGKDKKN